MGVMPVSRRTQLTTSWVRWRVLLRRRTSRRRSWAERLELGDGPAQAELGAIRLRREELERERPAGREEVGDPGHGGCARPAGTPARPGRSGSAGRPGRLLRQRFDVDSLAEGYEAELMAEVAFGGEHHRNAVLVGGGDDLVVADAAAGLDHRPDPGRGDGVEAVPEREEGVAGTTAPGRRDRQPWSPRCPPSRAGSAGRPRCRPPAGHG